MKVSLFVLVLLLIGKNEAIAQGTSKRVLFIGNSYTYVNDLPKLVADFATANSDTLIFDSSTPGGYTLQAHSTNSTTLSKIAQGNWDFVVFQEQSQRPAFPQSQVQSDVYPYAKYLDSAVRASNPCAETVFYMTWGRKNGDASNCTVWPPICTYRGMDSMLRYSYTQMATTNKGVISPVGPLWQYLIRNGFSTDLYSPDESHPSLAGSYAAACSFYTTFFRRDVSIVGFNSTLNPLIADSIRKAAKLIVYDSLSNWLIGSYDLKASFDTLKMSALSYSFINLSKNHNSQIWNFGFKTDTSANPGTVNFPGPGIYPVSLTVYSDCDSSFVLDTIQILPSSIEMDRRVAQIRLFPNPAYDQINIQLAQGKAVNYRILSIQGKTMLEGGVKYSNTINVSHLPSGSYLMIVESINGSYLREKFLIIRP